MSETSKKGRDYLESILSIATDPSNKKSARVTIPAGRFIIGLEVPAVDSTVINIEASKDGEVSTPVWRKIHKTDGSEAWNIATGQGNLFIFLDESAAFSYLRVSCVETQTEERIFNFILRRN